MALKTPPQFTKLPELSVFFPAYNEEKVITNTIEKALKILPQVSKKYEILVVNDGSTDQTAVLVEKLIRKHPQLRMITHTPNKGYGEALKTGLYHQKYQWCAYNDADGQFDFSEIINFITTQRQTQADMVIGYYKQRQVHWTRKLNTWLWKHLIWLMFGLKVHDIDTGFKLWHRRVIDQIPRLESQRGAFIESEWLIKVQKQGLKIVEVPVTHYPRTTGKGTGANINVIIGSFLDLFRLWRKM